MPGRHSGALHVFVRKNGAHGPAVWGRNGGHGWRQTHITLRGLGIKSVSTNVCAAMFLFVGEAEDTLAGVVRVCLSSGSDFSLCSTALFPANRVTLRIRELLCIFSN